MKKAVLILVSLVVLLFGSVLLWNAWITKNKIAYFKSLPSPVFPVTAITLTPKNWASTIHSVGFIHPEQGVTLVIQQAGTVAGVHFTSGQKVTANSLLLELDNSVELAQLQAAQANLPSLKAHYERSTSLFRSKTISLQELESSQAAYESQRATISALAGMIARRQIKAPFEGTLGIRQVQIGQYLQPGTPVVSLENNTHMKFRSSISQNFLPVLSIGQSLDLTTELFPHQRFTATIIAIEPMLDTQTGSATFEALVPNPEQLLRSGLFMEGSLEHSPVTDALVLPQHAVSFSLYGETVFRIIPQPDGSLAVEEVTITTGERQQDQVRVLSGLQAGDRIVTSGQLRLRSGSKVNVIESENERLTAVKQPLSE